VCADNPQVRLAEIEALLCEAGQRTGQLKDSVALEKRRPKAESMHGVRGLVKEADAIFTFLAHVSDLRKAWATRLGTPDLVRQLADHMYYEKLVRLYVCPLVYCIMLLVLPMRFKSLFF
jgi:hypothetical protein